MAAGSPASTAPPDPEITSCTIGVIYSRTAGFTIQLDLNMTRVHSQQSPPDFCSNQPSNVTHVELEALSFRSIALYQCNIADNRHSFPVLTQSIISLETHFVAIFKTLPRQRNLRFTRFP